MHPIPYNENSGFNQPGWEPVIDGLLWALDRFQQPVFKGGRYGADDFEERLSQYGDDFYEPPGPYARTRGVALQSLPELARGAYEGAMDIGGRMPAREVTEGLADALRGGPHSHGIEAGLAGGLEASVGVEDLLPFGPLAKGLSALGPLGKGLGAALPVAGSIFQKTGHRNPGAYLARIIGRYGNEVDKMRELAQTGEKMNKPTSSIVPSSTSVFGSERDTMGFIFDVKNPENLQYGGPRDLYTWEEMKPHKPFKHKRYQDAAKRLEYPVIPYRTGGEEDWLNVAMPMSPQQGSIFPPFGMDFGENIRISPGAFTLETHGGKPTWTLDPKLAPGQAGTEPIRALHRHLNKWARQGHSSFERINKMLQGWPYKTIWWTNPDKNVFDLDKIPMEQLWEERIRQMLAGDYNPTPSWRMDEILYDVDPSEIAGVKLPRKEPSLEEFQATYKKLKDYAEQHGLPIWMFSAQSDPELIARGLQTYLDDRNQLYRWQMRNDAVLGPVIESPLDPYTKGHIEAPGLNWTDDLVPNSQKPVIQWLLPSETGETFSASPLLIKLSKWLNKYNPLLGGDTGLTPEQILQQVPDMTGLPEEDLFVAAKFDKFHGGDFMTDEPPEYLYDTIQNTEKIPQAWDDFKKIFDPYFEPADLDDTFEWTADHVNKILDQMHKWLGEPAVEPGKGIIGAFADKTGIPANEIFDLVYSGDIPQTSTTAVLDDDLAEILAGKELLGFDDTAELTLDLADDVFDELEDPVVKDLANMAEKFKEALGTPSPEEVAEFEKIQKAINWNALKDPPTSEKEAKAQALAQWLSGIGYYTPSDMKPKNMVDVMMDFGKASGIPTSAIAEFMDTGVLPIPDAEWGKIAENIAKDYDFNTLAELQDLLGIL